MILGDKLFRVIQTLTKAEKASVSKNLALNTSIEKNSIKVFSFYCSQKVFDEDELQKFISKNKLKGSIGKLKSQLYQAILEVLKHLNRNNSASYKVNQLIADFDVLANKGLYPDARSRLTKAKKIAGEFELFSLLKTILEKEARIWPIFYSSTDKIRRLHKENYAEIAEVEIQSKLYNLIMDYFIEMMFLLSKTNSISEEETVEELKQLKRDHSYENFGKSKSNKSEILINYFPIVEAYINNDPEFFHRACKNMVKACISKRYYKVYKPAQVFGMLSNTEILLDKFLTYNDYGFVKEAMVSVEKDIAALDKEDKKLAQNIMFYRALDELIADHKYEEAINFLRFKMKSEKIDLDQITNSIYSYFYYLGFLYFLNGEYKKAIKFLNKLYLETEKDFTKFFEAEVILLIILSHLELNHPDSAEYLCTGYLKIIEEQSYRLPLRKYLILKIQSNAYSNLKELKKEILEDISSQKLKANSYYDLKQIDMIAWLKK